MPTINSANDDQEWRSLRKRGGGGGRCLTVLTREESVRGMECVRGLECYSPARVAVCRLLAVVKKCKRRRRGDKVMAEEVEKREVATDLMAVDHQTIHDGVSGHQRQEMNFNVAAGLGLLSLIAASKTELEKTAELRRQMETFLKSAKQGHDEGKVTPPNGLSDPEVTYAVSTTTIDGPSNLTAYSQEGHGVGSSQEVSGMSGVCDKHCDMYETQRCVDEVSCLEEELAAELERLQIDIETEGYGETGQQLEHQENVTQLSSNGKATGTATVSSSEEVINPNDEVTPEHYGVPPLELERRLHELLEARQEERIKELEAHLEFIKGKLQEKEVEVIWWKDTAKLISKQVPQSSRAKVICEDS
ncbi:protein POLAR LOCALIZATION DURING ASYMMETRIC DIVISION AND REDISTRIBUTION-like [Silene latifolia]|uniref:protein POLAR LOCALIZATION DURING ASYMMETRIC DIVISION AND REDISTRIBUTION-like n=1 Tax=Silene latifolia TaxID=37657 RepID=UPI003D7770FD